MLNVNEGKINQNSISSENKKNIIKQMENRIYRIRLSKSKECTAFFTKIYFPNKKRYIPVLITSNKIINETVLNQKNQRIYIFLNDEINSIDLDDDRIKYINKEYNITIYWNKRRFWFFWNKF